MLQASERLQLEVVALKDTIARKDRELGALAQLNKARDSLYVHFCTDTGEIPVFGRLPTCWGILAQEEHNSSYGFYDKSMIPAVLQCLHKMELDLILCRTNHWLSIVAEWEKDANNTSAAAL